ncbi:MAG TPA: glycerol-3-phosphate dehydrogenase, partial [Ideonella sp.]|nr:glycerol-3-phosphate dehydrogenase [Ideonella sp.]
MKLAFLGAGAWGTALAAAVAARSDSLLWARDARQVEAMLTSRRNERYLPGIELPAALALSADFDRATAHARDGLVIVATPMAALAEMLGRLPRPAPPVLWLCKGFEPGSG